MVHPKRLKKIKLEDVIAILTLFLFPAEVIIILHKIWNINSLKFQRCNNSSLWMFPAKEYSFIVTFIINTLIIKVNQINIKRTIKGSYMYR